MASNDKGAGPQVGQIVLFNSSGTIVAGIITAVANGVATVATISGSTWTNQGQVTQDPNLGSGHWNYPQFF